jgi:hemerythrin-like domain-containing protein
VGGTSLAEMEFVGNFLKMLCAEHRVIQDCLRVLAEQVSRMRSNSKIPRGDISLVLNCLKFLAEDIHHAKEEEMLFPVLHGMNCLNKGGPQCTLFMGLRLEFGPTQRLLQMVRETRPEILEKLKYREATRALIDANSPAGIPIEEHVAASTALQCMEFLLQDIEKPEVSKIFLNMAEAYLTVMDMHIQKEETCLFILASQLLTKAMQDELCSRASHVDRKYFELNIKVMNDLERLKAAYVQKM